MKSETTNAIPKSMPHSSPRNIRQFRAHCIVSARHGEALQAKALWSSTIFSMTVVKERRHHRWALNENAK